MNSTSKLARHATRSPAKLDRRRFLAGAGSIAIALPFLESAPGRSAWAAGAAPRFALFIGTSNGIIAEEFWPAALGPLDALAAEPKATSVLAEFASDLLFVRGLRLPGVSMASTHSESYVQLFTGAPQASTGREATSSAASIDWLLAPYLNPDGRAPLTLYSGMKQGYIDERLSFSAPGELVSALGNPYEVYQSLLTQAEAGSDASQGAATLEAVAARRQSAVDLVRDELSTLRGRAGLGSADQARIDLHLSSLREIETGIGQAQGVCSDVSLDVVGIDAAAETYRQNGKVEIVAKLQLELTAFAFACNLNHVASLQCGDGEDQTVYDVPSNERGWTFHHISHQNQSDGSVGTDALAVQAHAEIDRLRLETLRHGLARFAEHGLLDKAIVMWANQFTDSRSGSSADLPCIVAGNPSGVLASGQHVNAGQRYNGDLLTTVAHALGAELTVGVDAVPIDELFA